jgi:siderophore synthetase component
MAKKYTKRVKFERKVDKASTAARKTTPAANETWKKTKDTAPQKVKDAANTLYKKADKNSARLKKTMDYAEKKYVQADKRSQKNG